MVPAESAACGVPPVAADHSGMREVAAAARRGGRAGPGAPAQLSGGARSHHASSPTVSSGWLALEPERRHEAGLALAERVDELWSWEGVARTVDRRLEGSAGRPSQGWHAKRALTGHPRKRSWRVPVQSCLNRMPPDAGRPDSQADRGDHRPHRRHLGDHADPELERRGGLHRRAQDRRPARRDDRAVVVRLLDRHGDARLRRLAVAGEAGRRVRRGADPRQHPARDRLDRDPHRDRPLRRRSTPGSPSRTSRPTTRTGWSSTSTPSSTSGTSTTRRPGTTSRELHVPVESADRVPDARARRDPLVLGPGVADQEGQRPGHHHARLHHARPRPGTSPWSARSSAASATRRCGRRWWSSPRRPTSAAVGLEPAADQVGRGGRGEAAVRADDPQAGAPSDRPCGLG